MQKLRVLALGMLIVTVGCTDDRHVVGDSVTSAGGSPNSSGGQTGTLPGVGGNSAGTGSGIGGTLATGGAAGTSIAGSGGNSAAGGSGFGGTQSTGGAVAIAGAAGAIPDETCTAGPVTLKLTTSTPSAYCLKSCGGFVSIVTADNQPFASLSTDPCSLQVLCSTCSVPVCTDLYCGPVVMSNGSASTAWWGAYTEASTCGQNVACSHGRCTTSGHYIARFCATAASSSGSCDSTGAQTCIDVPFDFPTTATVQAVLPAVNGAGGAPPGSGGSTSTGGRPGTGGNGTGAATGGSRATGGSTATGGTRAIGGSVGLGGTGAIGGSVGLGGTGAVGGSVGSGGTNNGGAGGVCNSGCLFEGTDSTWCATPNADLVCWGPFPPDLPTIMTANGCTSIPTGAVRYCCPSKILTQCQ